MKRLSLFLTVFLFLIIFATQVIADIHNPKPYNNDLTLPMPDGAGMTFRPVFIGEGSNPFALKEFKVGARAGSSFKEYPTSVVIGGAFIQDNPHNQKDWLYYIGKYEVTEAQYYSVMEPGTKSDSQLPISKISWFDVQEFIQKYNLWLFQNAGDKLPRNEDAFGYIRLPTEIEWEFAARGGSEVDITHFDKKHPYPDPLAKYEWYAGPQSSHGKIKKIGILEPNDLKIHDMLGNVSEMTHSFYRIEYFQGRTGGFVARGGHSFTSKDKIRSSLREEIPFYKSIRNEIKPTGQPTLGFRLVISSQIYASRNTSRNLSSAWADYVNTSRSTPVATPSARIAAPTNVNRTNIQLSDALQSLERLNDVLKNMSDVPSTVWDQLGLLNASFQNIESTVKKAEHDSAFAWVKVASETGYLISNREMKEIPAKRKALAIAEDLGKTAIIDSIKKQISDKEINIEMGLENYGFAFIQLEKIEEESVKKGFEKYRNFLARRGSTEQIRFTGLVTKHFQEYFRNRRLNIAKWKTDFENF